MDRRVWVAVAGALAASALAGAYQGAVRALADKSDLYAVDGDTVAFAFERWRISNIDAPELHGKCDAETRLAYTAKKRLQALLESGQVSVERHGEDIYGRALVRLFVAGNDLGDQLVAEHLARPWTGHRQPWC